MSTLIKDLKEKGRTTPISWKDLIETILDSYEQHVEDLSHAVQKDAIQNIVDARDPEAGGLEIVFELKSSGKEMLVIGDHGTVGLTGRILKDDEYEKDLPEKERWGRFEGMAFRRKNPRALGARGQGKFIFVGMSKTRTILYDTLRKDGTYRIGARYLGMVNAWEGEDACRILSEYSPDLHPLTRAGTRIIIDDPDEMLKDAIRGGRFKRYIQTTWWPILADPTYNTSIVLKFDGNEEKVVFPEDLELLSDDTEDVRVWIREGDTIWRGGERGRRSLSIRKLHLCWSRKAPAEDVKGIMVVRGRMVVESVPASELMAGAPPDITDHIYGYIEGDEGVQFLLKKIEDPTHYRFQRRGGWGKKNIFGTLLGYVSGQLQQFAREKLELEEAEKARDFAPLLKRFNRIIEALGISPFDIGFIRPPTPPVEPPQPKPIDLIFSSPEFPRSLPRADYGEEIGNFRVNIANRTERPARVRIRVYTEQESIVRDTILDQDADVQPKETRQFGPFRLKITERYTLGECRIKGWLNCLQHPDFEKGVDLDKSTLRFWIGRNPPPSKGPFRDIKFVPELTCRIKDHIMCLDCRVDPHPEGGYILTCNGGHPAYRERCRTEEETNRYVIELMAKGLSQILIASDHELFRDIDDPYEIVGRSSAICSEILAKYYGVS